MLRLSGASQPIDARAYTLLSLAPRPPEHIHRPVCPSLNCCTPSRRLRCHSRRFDDTTGEDIMTRTVIVVLQSLLVASASVGV